MAIILLRLEFVFVVLLWTTTRGTGIGGIPSAKANGDEVNAYVDRVVELLKERLVQYGLEPFPLPDHILALTSQEGGVVLELGEASLTEGEVEGILSLHRVGDAEILYFNNRSVGLIGAFGFPHLKFQYNYELSLFNFGPKGVLFAFASDVLLNFTMSLNLTTLETNLDQFDITRVRHSKVITDIHPVFDKLIQVMSGLVMKLCQQQVLEMLKPHAESILQDTLRNISRPLN